jgi:hypothetical protein
MRQLLVIIPALLAAASCYNTQSLSVRDFRALGRRLRDTASVTTTHGGRLGLDAQATVRVGIRDTGYSDWVSAGHLHVTDEALFLEAPVADADIVAAVANNLDDREVELLTQMAPPGGQCLAETGPTGHAFRLTARSEGTLVPWLERFAVAQRRAGATLGMWWVETREPAFLWGKHTKTAWLLFDQVGGQPSARPVLAYGAPWSEVEWIDVNYLDSLYSTLAIPLFPLAMQDKDNGHQGPTSRLAEFPKRLWPDAQPEPLFTGNARRRAIVKLVAGARGGVTDAGDGSLDGSLALRFLNFFEVGGVVRRISLASDAVEPSRQSATLFGLATGLHIDRDGDPRFAFFLGVEALGRRGADAVEMLSLVLSPRIGLGHRVFLAVPIGTASIHRKNDAGVSVGHGARLFAALQVGLVY